MTTYPTGTSAARVDETYYDWRDRPVATKAGVLLDGSYVPDPIQKFRLDASVRPHAPPPAALRP